MHAITCTLRLLVLGGGYTVYSVIICTYHDIIKLYGQVSAHYQILKYSTRVQFVCMVFIIIFVFLKPVSSSVATDTAVPPGSSRYTDTLRRQYSLKTYLSGYRIFFQDAFWHDNVSWHCTKVAKYPSIHYNSIVNPLAVMHQLLWPIIIIT